MEYSNFSSTLVRCGECLRRAVWNDFMERKCTAQHFFEGRIQIVNCRTFRGSESTFFFQCKIYCLSTTRKICGTSRRYKFELYDDRKAETNFTQEHCILFSKRWKYLLWRFTATSPVQATGFYSFRLTFTPEDGSVAWETERRAV